MRPSYLILFLAAGLSLALKNDKPAYSLFTGEGRVVKYTKMLNELAEADLVFFGELHDNPIGHWLELEITKGLFEKKGRQLVMAAEMFERDNQLILDEYLHGQITQSSFESEARLWPNYKTDYKPLVEFAMTNGLDFVASNVPRRYASVVHKRGFEALDSLSEEALVFLPPLPIRYDPEVKCYADMMQMEGMGGGHVNENFPKAQALKDATMAHYTMQAWEAGKLVIHYNGSYHSNNFEGIVWHIRQAYPDLKILTIANVLQENLEDLDEENMNIASYVLCVPHSMTRTR